MTKDYFILSAKLHPPKSPDVWIGPFSDKDDAEQAILEARNGGFDIVEGEEVPRSIQTGIFAQVMTNSAARRKGLKFGTDDDNWMSNFDEAFGDVPRVEVDDSVEDTDQTQEEFDNEPSRVVPETVPQGVEKKKRGRPKGVAATKPVRQEVKQESRPIEAPKIKDGSLDQYIKGEDVVIVAQNTGVVEWLLRRGIRGELITRVNHPSQIEGKAVVGVIPTWLVRHAKVQGIINMPKLSPQQRESSYLSPDEMDRAGAQIDWYGPPPFLGTTR